MSLTVDNVNTRVNTYCQTITGSYEPSVVRIDVNGEQDKVALNNGTWSLFVKLESGKNTFSIEPYSAAGNKLPATSVDIHVDAAVTQVVQPKNILDEWSSLVGLDRRANEKNSTFKNRLLRFARIQKDSTQRGMSRILNYEYGLPEELRYMSLEVRRDAEDKPVTTGAYCVVTGVAMQVTSDDINTSEVVVVDPITLTAPLTRKICEIPETNLVVKDQSGNQVPTTQYVIDYDRNRVVFNSNKHAKSYVELSYQYWHRELLSENTIASLMGSINAISVNSQGAFKLEFLEDTSDFDATDSADKLLPFPGFVAVAIKAHIPATVLPNQDLVILGVSKTRVLGLSQNMLKYLNDRGTAYDAPLGGWTKVLVNAAQLVWKHVKFGESTWQSSKTPESVSVLPHITNAKGTMYSRSGQTEELYLSELQALGYTAANSTSIGVPSKEWHSGVGTENDLDPGISEGRSLNLQDLILMYELAKRSGLIRTGAITDIDQLERINGNS